MKRFISEDGWHIDVLSRHRHASYPDGQGSLTIVSVEEAGSLAGEPAGEPDMLIEVVDKVTDDEMHKAAWELYEGAFGELRAMAVQRHLMYQSEFDEVMIDTRVEKYLCYDDSGKLCGMSTYTNDLYSIPLIAPEYFARRWPELYRQSRVWYCGFAATAPDARGTQAWSELIKAMYLRAAEKDGIIAMDMCRHNVDNRNAARVVRLMLHRLSGGKVQAECMDEQSYWMYEFPTAS